MGNSAFSQDSSAVTDGYYITTQDDTTTLTNSFSLGSLTTGLVLNTVAAGVSTLTKATEGTDYLGVPSIGVSVQAYDATLVALAAYNTDGLLTQTAANTFTGRTLTGTANEVTVTNGNGVAGNPTLSLPAALTFTGKTVTGGAYASASATLFTFTSGSIGSAVTGTTQAFGTSDTTIATTAFVQAAREQVVNAQTLAYTAVAGDLAKVIRYTGAGGVTLSLTAAATLTDGWFATLRNDSSGTITIDPNGAETINGAATLAVEAGKAVIIYTNGTLFYTVGENAATSSGLAAATQAEMESASSNTVAVTPGRAQYHPGAAKFWVTFTFSAGTPTITVSHNVSSLTDNGVGDCTINFTTSFSAANYALAGVGTKGTGSEGYSMSVTSRATSSTRVITGYLNSAAVLAGDDSSVVLGQRSVIGYGDQ